MLWKENCCGSSVRCKTLVVVEAVVGCVSCSLVAMCGVVPVRCSEIVVVTVCSSVRWCCCCCGSVVVVGAEGRAGSVGCSSLLPRDVLGDVAAVTAAAHPVGGLEVEEVVAPATAVVAVVAGTCLEEVDAVAKAQACCWSRRSC